MLILHDPLFVGFTRSYCENHFENQRLLDILLGNILYPFGFVFFFDVPPAHLLKTRGGLQLDLLDFPGFFEAPPVFVAFIKDFGNFVTEFRPRKNVTFPQGEFCKEFMILMVSTGSIEGRTYWNYSYFLISSNVIPVAKFLL